MEYVLDVSERNGNALPILVAHNATFDVKVLLLACWRVGMDVPSCWHVGDTYRVVKSIALQERKEGRCDPFALAKAIREAKASPDGDVQEDLKPKKDGKKVKDLCYFFGCVYCSEFDLADIVVRPEVTA